MFHERKVPFHKQQRLFKFVTPALKQQQFPADEGFQAVFKVIPLLHRDFNGSTFAKLFLAV
jgi:hypothetical protein